MRGFGGHHFYGGPGPRFFPGGFSFLLLLVILGLLVYLVMLARRDAGRTAAVATSVDSPPPPPVPATPGDILKMRYARGEITKDEYETMRRDIE